ncbi:hypothetical protein [Phaeodactylibacter xiamenensis]|uniref:hypothetical protein n=1 Tax=Phaeodactylibacter xiamenensis TaxID=1524460 RepID=UPI003BAD65E2
MQARYFLLLMILAGTTLQAQEQPPELHIGYFAPFGVQIGGSVAYTDVLKQPIGAHQWWWRAQAGYFAQPNVSDAVFLHPEVEYRRCRPGQYFYASSSIGSSLAYTLSKQEGTLNLASGTIDYQKEGSLYIIPRISLGIGVAPRKRLGGYLRASYGQQLGGDNGRQAFFSAAAGLAISMHSKP